ncbi:MAG: VPLPA-CTERM sorting domain-containing protein [Nitrospirae bacterium]|nr:VPLPA-CTERM sorting domain-containing protein [Candidatus Manganitrophaceae bacterium]
MKKLIVVLALLLGTIAGGQSAANADELTFPLDQLISPISIPNIPPQAVVTMADDGNKVRFDITNISSGKLQSLFFNFSGDPLGHDPRDLRFSDVMVEGSALGSDAFRTRLAPTDTARRGNLFVEGGGFFDGKLVLNRDFLLGSGDTLSFDLGINGVNLSPNDFNVKSLADGSGGPTFTLASRIIGLSGGSVWVGGLTPVPLPASFLLFGSSLIGLAAIARRKLAA